MFTDLLKQIDSSSILPADASMRQKLEVLEYLIQEYAIDSKHQNDYDYEHIFSDGQYTRRIFIPAGDLVIGMVHNTAHLNRVVSGYCAIACNAGVITAISGFEFFSEIGEKKAVFAIKDTIYETIHKTTLTDLDLIKIKLVSNSDLSWVHRRLQLCLG